jgi:hypothetical protein
VEKVTEETFYDLYAYVSPNNIRLIKSRIIRWAGHVARMAKRRGAWWGNVREIYHLLDLGVDGKIILKWVCNK